MIVTLLAAGLSDGRAVVGIALDGSALLLGREVSAGTLISALLDGVVLAMGVFLAITTWAASPKLQSDSAAPAKGTIYRPDLWKVY
jgi:hypothetical protein